MAVENGGLDPNGAFLANDNASLDGLFGDEVHQSHAAPVPVVHLSPVDPVGGLIVQYLARDNAMMILDEISDISDMPLTHLFFHLSAALLQKNFA